MGKKDIQKHSPIANRFKNHSLSILFILVIFILVEIFVVLFQYRMHLLDTIKETTLPESLVSFEPSGYPQFITYGVPYVSAESAIVLDNKSKRVLYEKKPDLRFSMASTTKLMTALVALEYFEFNDILTVKNGFTEGSVIGFAEGEQLYFDDLLYGLLLQSGNDAANIIADNYPGGLSGFVQRMNQKAAEIGLKNTHFADPAGLNDDQNYTTAYDLATFSSYALTNPTLARVVNTKRKLFTDVSGTNVYDVYNLNQLLGTNGVIGIKTGTTRGAGEVLTTAVEKNGRDYIIVVMKSEDRFSDTLNLIGLLDNNIRVYSADEL